MGGNYSIWREIIFSMTDLLPAHHQQCSQNLFLNMPSLMSDDDMPVEGRGGGGNDPNEEKEHVVIPPSKEGIEFCSRDDVLCGRGGGTNAHPGNRRFRDLINASRRAYLNARQSDKPAISRSIVRAIREMNGRFLKKDEKSGLWHEIGDDSAREKAGQALRRQRARHLQTMRMQQGMPGMGGPGGMQGGPDAMGNMSDHHLFVKTD